MSFRRMVLAAAIPVLTAATAAAQDGDSARAVVDRIFAGAIYPDSTGCAAAVVRDGAILFQAGYGTADLEQPARITPQTVFNIASISKQFTAMAVLLLAQEGRLSLDDDVRRYIPEMPDFGARITLRQLMHHTSGLRDLWDLLGFAGHRTDDVVTRGDVLSWLSRQRGLNFPPGQQHLYNNTGYILLGILAERVSGTPLPQLLEQRIFRPLGMAHTRYEPGLGCSVCAPTLTLEDGTPFAGKTNDPFSRELGGITGNAGLFSTAHDLGRFAAMLANGGELGGVRIVKAATLRQFIRPQPGAGTRGLGFEVFCREGTVPDRVGCKTPYAYGHTGYTGTSLWIDPSRGIWVVLLSNRTYLPRAENRIRLVRRRLFNLVTGILPPPPTAPVDTSPETR